MKKYTGREFQAKYDLNGFEADGEDVEITLALDTPWRIYCLFGDRAGSITVTGDGDGDAMRVGEGDGDAIRDGTGYGSAIRGGTGKGEARRASSCSTNWGVFRRY